MSQFISQFFDVSPLSLQAAVDVHQLRRMSARGGKKKLTKMSKSARAGVLFPVGRMMRYLRASTHKYRIGAGAPVYMAAVIEYLAGTEAEQKQV